VETEEGQQLTVKGMQIDEFLLALKDHAKQEYLFK